MEALGKKWTLGALLLTLLAGGEGVAARLSDDEITKRLIAESTAAYPANCPCPYTVASNGSRCGGRSAYSRPGGRSPLCYPADVTEEMIKEYRRRHSD